MYMYIFLNGFDQKGKKNINTYYITDIHKIGQVPTDLFN